MKNSLKLLSLLLGIGLSVPIAAQTTAFTATITDPSGVPYANCNWTATLIDAIPGTPSKFPNGTPVSPRAYSGQCNDVGLLSYSLWDNSKLSPSGSTWTFAVTDSTGGHAFTVPTLSVTGASQNSSASFTAVAPCFSATGVPCGGGGGAITANFVSDAVLDTTCSMDGTTANLTCTDAPFGTCPTGKTISVENAATDSGGFFGSLLTTVASCSSSTVAVLASPSTHATGANYSARWGTDNQPAFNTQFASVVGGTFIIPPGSYLFNYHQDGSAQYVAQSNQELWIQKNAHLYVVGPFGCPSGPLPRCLDGQSLDIMMWIKLPSPTGAFSNFHLQIDGIIEGDNVHGGSGVPYLNQSALVMNRTDQGWVQHVNIDGSGLVQNLYGFSFHLSGTDVNVRGIAHTRVAKGLNVNASGIQADMTLNNSFGMESAAANVIIRHNTFSGGSGGISLGGGTGPGGTDCTGDVVEGNTFINMPDGDSGNIKLADCVVGAVIANNTLDVGNNGYGINMTDSAGIGYRVANNLIVNNTISCRAKAVPGPTGQGILEESAHGGVGNNMFVNNRVFPALGAVGCNTAINLSPVIGEDIVSGGNYQAANTGGGAVDLLISFGGVPVSLQGPMLSGSQTYVINSGTVDPTSWYVTTSGGTIFLNMKASKVTIGGTNTAPVVATPTVGQSACIYAAGPPVQIGKCTTVVSSTGACTCSP